MDLATFGAILSFALELEERAAAFYTETARGELEDIFIDLGRSSNKRANRMERTRREGVAEMILEPITGLDSDDYYVELSVNAHEPELLAQAIALEEIAQHFYSDAAAKIPIREVVRIFQRMANENEKRRERLVDVRL